MPQPKKRENVKAIQLSNDPSGTPQSTSSGHGNRLEGTNEVVKGALTLPVLDAGLMECHSVKHQSLADAKLTDSLIILTRGSEVVVMLGGSKTSDVYSTWLLEGHRADGHWPMYKSGLFSDPSYSDEEFTGSAPVEVLILFSIAAGKEAPALMILLLIKVTMNSWAGDGINSTTPIDVFELYERRGNLEIKVYQQSHGKW